jgi:tRNA(fMet)-specific endonuclease VapC
MSLFVLDTDTLSLYRRGQPLVVQKMLRQSLNTLATTAITVEEQLTGWYTLLRKQRSREQLALAYRNLVETVVELNQFRLLSFTEEAIDRYQQLRTLKLGVRANDLRIAAIALIEGATVVTRNVADFRRVPDLNVENWAD